MNSRSQTLDDKIKRNCPKCRVTKCHIPKEAFEQREKKNIFLPRQNLEGFEDAECLEKRENTGEVRHGSEGDGDKGEKRSSSQLQRLQERAPRTHLLGRRVL